MKPIATVSVVLLFLGTAAVPVRAQDGDAVTLVNGYYQRYLGRNADPGGLVNWVADLRAAGPAAVQAGILGSDEYYQRRGSTPEGFIAGLYSDVLGRSASPAEIQTWLNALYQSASRTELAGQFLAAAQPELGQRLGANSAYPPAYVPPMRWHGNWYRHRGWFHR